MSPPLSRVLRSGSPLSESDLLSLLVIAAVVGLLFAFLVGAQGADGRRWWRSRFGVGWPTLLTLYVVTVLGLWLPVALGSRVPDRHDFGFLVGTLLFALGALLAAHSLANVRPYSLLLLGGTVHASDAEAGRLAVEGRVEVADGEDGGTTEAPLSGDRTVVRRLKVDTVPADDAESGRNDRRETAVNRLETRRFVVRDATGGVLVRPERAQLRIASEESRTFDPGDDLPASLSAVLAEAGVSRGETTLVCEEATLAPGDDVFVHGRASRRDGRLVVDGGREFLVVPGSRADALNDLRGVVVREGLLGVGLGIVGLLVMALRTGAFAV